MSRDVSEFKAWFKEDIRRVLLGVNAASLSAGPTYAADAYRAGFVAALCSVALVIGIEPKAVMLSETTESHL